MIKEIPANTIPVIPLLPGWKRISDASHYREHGPWGCTERWYVELWANKDGSQIFVKGEKERGPLYEKIIVGFSADRWELEKAVLEVEKKIGDHEAGRQIRQDWQAGKLGE